MADYETDMESTIESIIIPLKVNGTDGGGIDVNISLLNNVSEVKQDMIEKALGEDFNGDPGLYRLRLHLDGDEKISLDEENNPIALPTDRTTTDIVGIELHRQGEACTISFVNVTDSFDPDLNEAIKPKAGQLA